MPVPSNKKTNLLKFGILCALIFWQLNIVSIYIVEPFLSGNGLSWKRAENEYFGSDFLHYYVSGVMSRSADHLRIYDVPVHFPYLNNLIAPRVVTKNSCINFSPQMIAIMSAVSLLSPVSAYIVWTLSSFAFGVTGLFYLLQRMGRLSNYQVAVFIIVTSASLSSITALRMGQWTWWLIGFFCFFFLLSLQKKQIPSGICLGLLVFKPQFCLPILITTALQKRWLSLSIAAITFTIFSAWAVILIGWDNVLHYPQIIAALQTRSDLRADIMSHCSLRGLFSSVLPFSTAVWTANILYFCALGTFGAFALQCILKRNVIRDHLEWTWAIGVLTALIFSPLMFQYDALLVCLAAALTLRTLNPLQINRLQPLSLRIWHWIFFLYPIFTWARGVLGNELNYLYSFVNIGLLLCAVSYFKYRANHNEEPILS
jgi:hypothetical protein